MTPSLRTCIVIGIVLAVLLLVGVGAVLENDLVLSGQGEWTGP